MKTTHSLPHRRLVGATSLGFAVVPALLGTLVALGATAAAADTLPTRTVRVLQSHEAATVDGLQSVPQADLNLRAAVSVNAWAFGKGGTKRAVQRSNLGVPAAVYAGVPASAPPMLPADPTTHIHNFLVEGDTAQAWATMSAQGVPHLQVVGHGQFRADATAAWTSRYTLGGSTSKELVLRFTVPPTVVDGDTEGDAPAWWRARLRTDVLVNGFPAWSTEALRLRADPVWPGQIGAPPTLGLLQTFGDPLVFPTDDEDTPAAAGGLNNDSNGGNMKLPSASRTVYLNLGRYNPGQSVELSMIVRGTAFTQPTSAGGTDHQCRPRPGNDPLLKWFCSRGSVSVRMGQFVPQLTLLP